MSVLWKPTKCRLWEHCLEVCKVNAPVENGLDISMVFNSTVAVKALESAVEKHDVRSCIIGVGDWWDQ